MVQQQLFNIGTPHPIIHPPLHDPPSQIKLPVCIQHVPITFSSIWSQFSSFVKVWATEKKGEWYLEPGEYAFWDKTIEGGKSYMAGESCEEREYLRKYSSSLSKWQRLAYDFAIQNPKSILHVKTKTHEWRIFLRGEYVEFMLPYQTRGGEKSYVSRTGRTKVQINDD